MKLGLHSMRNHQNNTVPIFSNITNRINYLEQKNISVNKKLVAYMNCFERRLMSQRSQDSESKDKNTSTFRIHPSKKIKLKLNPGIQFNENGTVSKETYNQQRNYKIQSQSKQRYLKNSKHLIPKKGSGFRLNDVSLRQKYLENDSIQLESLKKGKIFLQRSENFQSIDRSVENKEEFKISLKTNNFLKTHSGIEHKKSPYTQILNFLGKRQHNKKGGQQKLKLIQIKKKLLQEQEKSLVEYQKCILYKQKMVQKIKNQKLGQVNNETGVKKNFEQSQVRILANDDDS